uniref:non-specific serine/threonine protein kinase n=1 Tax=Brassica campestris TaxID=3711 RepID=M4CN92_BRACM
MGKARSMVSLFILVIFLVRAQRSTAESTTEFIFQGFKGNQSDIQLQGDSTITPSGLLRLTDRNSNLAGTAFYHQPVRLLDSNSSVRSFSTSFVFVIIPSSSDNGGFGFTFTLSPTPNRTDAESAQYLGLLNERNDGDPSNHVFAVEFDTVHGFKDDTNRIGNHIGLNFNSLSSEVQEPVAYFNKDGKKEDFQLASGEPIQVFLDYDGPTKTLNLTVYPTRLGSKPRTPMISQQHVPKLLQVVQEEMFVGFTAATGRDQSSAHYVMGWSFSSGGDRPVAATLNPSELPPSPPNRAKKREEILEDWEVDHPHRFRYKDLYAATDGFKENRIVGSGGFGTVYRGSSIKTKSSSCDQIAVKKITRNSMQGVREFVAEIESLGRLRHKNVVNLQGWCKHGNDLLLVYDYIPNGCLDSLLYSKPRRSGAVLSWNARFQIAKGVAAGLLYLHEEWEKIVIHRDVNVLIDADMNPRLGDFGLARLHERGSLQHTTVVVGTIGYMAPELTRNGNSSSASDVFAFGVLLLEIVSGRKPTDSGSFFLGDWVMELQVSGEILGAVDLRLGSGFDEEEARLALAVGLLCCHPKMGYRPTMGMVHKYLNRDEDVPEVEVEVEEYSHSSRSKYYGGGYVSSFDRVSSSSLTRISSSSFISAR